MGDHLVLGVCSDADVLKFKGPTIFNTHERAEIMRHCKFIDEVVEDVEYATTLNQLEKVGCNYFSHGDDPCYDKEGNDIL